MVASLPVVSQANPEHIRTGYHHAAGEASCPFPALNSLGEPLTAWGRLPWLWASYRPHKKEVKESSRETLRADAEARLEAAAQQQREESARWLDESGVGSTAEGSTTAVASARSSAARKPRTPKQRANDARYGQKMKRESLAAAHQEALWMNADREGDDVFPSALLDEPDALFGEGS